MQPRLVPLLTAAFVITAALTGVAPALADDFVLVTATVTTPEPSPDDPFTIRTTVSNADDSETSYVLESVRVRRGESRTSETLSERRVGASLSPGRTLSVDLAATLNETGTQTVYVHLTLAGAQRRHVVQPVTVEVYEPHPEVSVSTGSALGDRQRLTVTLSNGFDQNLRNVEVVLDGNEALEITNPRRATAVVQPGTDMAFDYEVVPVDAGDLPVEVTVRYTLGDRRRTFTASYTPDFSGTDAITDRPQLELSVQKALPGATRMVNVTVANGRDRAMDQVRISVAAEGVRFDIAERVQARIPAGATETFRFPATVAEAGTYPVNVTVAYTDGGIPQRFVRTYRANFDAPANPAEITLTSVEAIQQGGRIEVSATASNVGAGLAEGVIVSVGNQARNVEATDYFVGSVEGSDFASFTITTTVDGNVSAIPIEVTYVVGSVEQSVTTEVPVRQVAVERPGGNGGFPVVPVLGAVVVLVVIGLAYRRWG